MNYLELLQKGLRSCAKLILQKIAQDPDNKNELLITFDTNNNKVLLPKYLKNQYPEKITIVLHKDFENLIVEDDYFEVTLAFGEKDETIRVPFDMIYKLEDPNEGFVLDFHVEKNFSEDNIIKLFPK